MSEAVLQAIRDRRSIYLAKMDKADPLADDDRNKFDALQYVVEAMDHTLADAEEALGLPRSSPAIG